MCDACVHKGGLKPYSFHFMSRSKHCYWERNACLNINIFKYLFPNETNVINFHPLEVVDRGSETQLEVGENLNI